MVIVAQSFIAHHISRAMLLPLVEIFGELLIEDCSLDFEIPPGQVWLDSSLYRIPSWLESLLFENVALKAPHKAGLECCTFAAF